MSDPTDASAVNLKITSSSIVVPDYIENTDAQSDPSRINQQRVLPAAIQTRLIGNLFSNNPSSDAQGSGLQATTIIPNSSSASFIFTLTDNQGRELIAVPDIAFYVGDEVDPSFQWPNRDHGMGNMPATVFNDWGLTNNKNVVTRAIMRNNSGSDQNVICVCRFRIIANPGTSTGV